MKSIQFIISTIIFLFLWLPMFVVGLFAVAILLRPLHKWDGKTTWFGNRLYGRVGNQHMPANPTRFDEWNFLALRNPISNFGKEVLSVNKALGWPWFNDQHVVGRLYWKYGWKDPVGDFRTFIYRPYFK